MPEADLIVNLQGDEPEISGEALDLVVALLEADPGAPMATLATPIRDEAVYRDPSCVKVVRSRAGRALYFSRSPIPHHRDGLPDFAADPPVALLHLGPLRLPPRLPPRSSPNCPPRPWSRPRSSNSSGSSKPAIRSPWGSCRSGASGSTRPTIIDDSSNAGRRGAGPSSIEGPSGNPSYRRRMVWRSAALWGRIGAERRPASIRGPRASRNLPARSPIREHAAARLRGRPEEESFVSPAHPPEREGHWQSVLQAVEARLAVARQKLSVLGNDPKRPAFERIYAQMLGSRDQVADAVRRLPQETGDLYKEDHHRVDEAIAALDRLFQKWDAQTTSR